MVDRMPTPAISNGILSGINSIDTLRSMSFGSSSMEPYYLFKAPAFILITGLLMIDNFIRKTNKKVAEEKAAKAAAEAAKKKTK